MSTVADVDELQARLGYRFRDATLLRQALTHPSIAHESAARADHNQRLEFLGDAVLQLALTRALYDQFRDLDEGRLTKGRAHLANSRSLARQARRIELGQHLILSRGEETSGGRNRDGALADAFEAVIGAIYLDGGIEPATAFVLSQFQNEHGVFDSPPSLDNPKGALQELLQSRSPDPILYRVESSSGPDHAREYEVSVSHRGVELGRGHGRNKKDAESKAAEMAVESLRAVNDPAASPAPPQSGA